MNDRYDIAMGNGTIHVIYDGRNEDLAFADVFPADRLAGIGIAEGAPVTVANVTETQVKTALAQHYDVGLDEFQDHYVEINSKTGNVTVRPNSGFGV